MIDKIHAIVSLVPNAEVVVRDNDIVEWINPSVAPITDAQIQAEILRLQADYDAKQYQRNRAKEYPSIVDQLDTLYHGGYDAWKVSIDAVKNKFPKGAA
jgi:hypothetical protein